MASLTLWTWVWVSSGSWWWTGKPRGLQLMGSQGIRHSWATELNWRRAPWTLPWESEISFILLSAPSIIKMLNGVALYSCCDLITLILWLWLAFKFPQTLRSSKCKNIKMKKNRRWFWDVEGREQKQEPGNMTTAPGPPSPGAYHHPVHTVTMVWDALCRKLELKRNRNAYWRVWREYARVLGVMFVEQCVSILECQLFT